MKGLSHVHVECWHGSRRVVGKALANGQLRIIKGDRHEAD